MLVAPKMTKKNERQKNPTPTDSPYGVGVRVDLHEEAVLGVVAVADVAAKVERRHARRARQDPINPPREVGRGDLRPLVAAHVKAHNVRVVDAPVWRNEQTSQEREAGRDEGKKNKKGREDTCGCRVGQGTTTR